jgi:serine/threonine-protein kinase
MSANVMSAWESEALEEAVLSYLKEAESGRPPAREEFLARYPDLAEELTTFLADQDRLSTVLAPLRQLAPGGGSDPRTERTVDYRGPGGAAALPGVPGYEVLEVLGHGGMGVVYRARQVGLDRVVALKMIRTDLLLDEGARARFRAEARAVAKLEHPHIVRVHDSGEHAGRPYFALELMSGGSLAEKLKEEGPWPARAAAELVVRLAGAVEHAHRQGIVHRDLKPANVLLAADGTPKITDFGLCHWREGEGLTRAGDRVGTPAFMAPEQAEGRSASVGPASDVFGLGAILYMLLTGRPPFPAETMAETLTLAPRAEVRPARQLNARVPRALERICCKALALEPGRRYPSAAALQADLRRYLHRSRRLLLAGLLAGLVLAGVGLGLLARRAARPAPAAPAPAAPLSGELIVNLWTPGGQGKRGLRVDEPGALPARRGEMVHLEARLNQPAHAYLLLLDSRGEVTPLYPWNGVELTHDLSTPPPVRPPRQVVHSPTTEDADDPSKGWPLDEHDGLETVLLLARRTPLPGDVKLAEVVGKMPVVPLGHPAEVAVRGFDPGGGLTEINRGEYRGFQKGADDIDDPLLKLMGRLRRHFEMVRAVRFAHQGR